MKRELLYAVCIMFFLAGCNAQPVVTLTAGATETQIIPTTPMLPTSTAVLPITPSPSTTPTSSITVESPHVNPPIIHEQPGDAYETIVSLPIGKDSIIQYEKHPESYQGPNAIAVLPDGSFMIADPVGERLLHVSTDGLILDTVDLEQLGIGFILDIRVKGDNIYLLEYGYKKIRVHQLALDGIVINTDEIPYDYTVGKDEDSLEVILTGIAIDCDDNIILELASGSRLLPLSAVQKQIPYDQITQGISCNGQLYSVNNPGPGQTPRILAGYTTYETQLTKGFGGLRLLEVSEDGSFYAGRNDVLIDPNVKVDLTVHYIDDDGIVQGVARVPLSEFYYYIMRSTAVAPSGDVYTLLPRHDSLDIIRLNFYRELEPFIPGAVIPQITVSENTQ